MNHAPAGAILALPTWNNFGNACLQDAWILLYWEQSPESSGWTWIGDMSSNASENSAHLCELWRRQEKAMSIFKTALQMLPAWFFRDSLWSATLSFSASSPGQREMDSPYPAFSAMSLHTLRAHSDLIHQSQQFLCMVTACSCWGWVSSAKPQDSRLRGTFCLTYLRSDKHNSHMLRDCAYSSISQLVTTAKYSTSSFPQNKRHNRPFRHLSLKSFWRVAGANGTDNRQHPPTGTPALNSVVKLIWQPWCGRFKWASSPVKIKDSTQERLQASGQLDKALVRLGPKPWLEFHEKGCEYSLKGISSPPFFRAVGQR